MGSLHGKIRGALNRIIDSGVSQLLTNIGTVAIVSLLLKGVSFYKEILTAKFYGVSEILDTFIIAVLIPSFIQNVFINSYGSVFIPNYVFEKTNAKSVASFQTSSLLITLLVSLGLGIIAYLGTDTYLETLFPNHDEWYYDLIKKQLWIILPCMPFWAISSLIGGLLMVDDEYLHSSLNGIFIPTITIVLLLVFQSEPSESTLALGMLFGSILSTLYLIFISHSKKILIIGKPDFTSSNIREMIKQMPAKMSSGLINGMNPMVDQYFSAQMAVGAIAALNYGYKIPMVTISLISGPLGSTLLPYFSKKAAQDFKTTFIHLKKMLGVSLISLSIITVILIFLSEFIVEIFFERGAFTTTDTKMVFSIQQMYLIQIPFYVAGIIMNRYLTAINRNNFLVISSLISLALNISLNYIFMKLMGTKGLALATSLVSIGNAMAIYWYINRLYFKNKHV